METFENRDDKRETERTPTQSDNNNGTLGQEGGIPNKREQHPFEKEHRNAQEEQSGIAEYDRHHKEDHPHTNYPVSEEKGDWEEEIDPTLPGNQPDNEMHRHSENNAGDAID